MDKRKRYNHVLWEIDFLANWIVPQDLAGIFDNLNMRYYQIEKYYPRFSYN